VQQEEPLMAPPLEPVTPQETAPAVIELKPVTPAQDEPEIPAAAQAEPELPAMAPELAPPAPAEPAAVAPEQPVAPPPPPSEPVAQVVPEIQVVAPAAPVDLEPPAPEPPAVEEQAFELPAAAPQAGAFRVVVRLSDGDGVEVGEFRDFGTAMEGAQEVIEQFSNANGSWPFYAGRFIRPDLIVSVDVVGA
jgi:hypothetical protein